MSLKHGVYAQEKATSLVTPLVADVGIPFVVGAAPVQSAGSPARPNVPVLCTSWDEAVAKLGSPMTGRLTRFASSCTPTSSCSAASPSFSVM